MLELRGITAGYGGSTVLRGVDIQVGSGSVVAVLGPNGAGKTTLLRVAGRSLDVDSGTVALDGADITHVKRHKVAARGLCHVPDGRGVFPALTVRENIQLFGRNLRGSDAAEMAVEAFPSLARRLDALAGSLSGGERQMLALVRPWIHKPPVVLLDEISMGLAPLVIDDVYLFLSRLSANGCALLIVEQYIGRVRELATHVYLMSKGQIAFSGLIDDLGDEQEVIGHYFGSPQ